MTTLTSIWYWISRYSLDLDPDNIRTRAMTTLTSIWYCISRYSQITSELNSNDHTDFYLILIATVQITSEQQQWPHWLLSDTGSRYHLTSTMLNDHTDFYLILTLAQTVQCEVILMWFKPLTSYVENESFAIEPRHPHINLKNCNYLLDSIRMTEIWSLFCQEQVGIVRRISASIEWNIYYSLLLFTGWAPDKTWQ